MKVSELVNQLSNADSNAEVKIMLNAQELKDLRVVQLLSDSTSKQVILSVDEPYEVERG